MQETRIKPMVEGGVLAAVAIVFAFISVYIPLIGPLLNLLWPVPIILLGVRHGFKWSLLATLVAGLLIAMLMHPLQAVSVVVGFGLIGIALGYALRAGYSLPRAVLLGAAASLASKIAVFFLGSAIMGVNPLDLQTDAMRDAVSETVALYQGMGFSEQQLAQMSDTMNQLIGILKIIFPAGFVLAALADTLLNYWAAKAILQKLGHRVPGFPPFRRWTMPQPVAYAFLTALVMMYWGSTRDITWLYQTGLNLQVFCSILLLVQGLALFYYLADKYNLSRLVRGIILVLVLTNGFFSQILMIAGVLDLFIDFRHLRNPGLS